MPAPPARPARRRPGPPRRRPAPAAAALFALAAAAGCSSTDVEKESCTIVCDFRRVCAGSAADRAGCVDVCARWARGESGAGGAAGAGGAGGDAGAGGAAGAGGEPGPEVAGSLPSRRRVAAERCAACVYDRPCSVSLEKCGDECRDVPGG